MKTKRNKGGIAPKIQCLKEWAIEKGLPRIKDKTDQTIYNPNFPIRHANNI